VFAGLSFLAYKLRFDSSFLLSEHLGTEAKVLSIGTEANVLSIGTEAEVLSIGTEAEGP